MSENQQLMNEAKALNLTYEQVYAGLEQAFPVGENKPYIGSLANHFRGKLKAYGAVDGLIECMDNASLRRFINHFSLTALSPAKGEWNSVCNRTACNNGRAVFFNHSTKKYYCPACAKLINDANHADAMRLFGHELCTVARFAPLGQ